MANKQLTGHATEGHANVSGPTDQPASRYTPGPWYCAYTVPMTGAVKVKRPGADTVVAWVCAEDTEGGTRDAAQANAHLIAAAPELAEVLRNICFGGNVNRGTYWAVDASDIEKARTLLDRVEAK